VCDEGRGVGELGQSVYLDFGEAIERLGMESIKEYYGNLFDMYEHITDENPYQTPMRIYPAAHYTMGGLWVDYNLMSNLPGLFVIGEANFSDHGANRLGASALMQGLADGYFILPQTIGDYLAGATPYDESANSSDIKASAEALAKESSERIERLLSIGKSSSSGQGSRSVRSLHQSLGEIMWNHCGMTRNSEGLTTALDQLSSLKEEFWKTALVHGESGNLNQNLEQAGRVADFIDFSQLMCRDALAREESCGGHFREEHQEQGEAARDDKNFSHVAAWQYQGEGNPPTLEQEPLKFDELKAVKRSYQ
jgi:succinate dehydrogenase / fumarate reductase flavoprotein subunit